MGALTSSLSEMVVPGPASPVAQDEGLAVPPPCESLAGFTPDVGLGVLPPCESVARFTPDVGLGVCAPLVAALATLAQGPAVFTAAAFAGNIFSRR